MTSSPSYQDRRHALTTALEEAELSTAVLLTPASIAYYTGNLISTEAALVHADGSWFVLSPEYDAFNFSVAEPELEIQTYSHGVSLERALGDRLSAARARIAMEFVGLSANGLRELETRCDGPLDDCGQLISQQRAVKDEWELQCIHNAAAVTRQVYAELPRVLAEPLREREIAAFIYERLLDLGSEHMASQPYVKSGERALLTHARWSDRMIDPSDHLLLEFAACVERYHAPLMRTRLRSNRSKSYDTARQAVLEARHSVLEALRPGASSREIYRAYMKPLSGHGVVEMNRHALGYSIGPAFPPSWSEPAVFWIDGQRDEELQEGMVLHLVPGVVDPAKNIEHIGISELVAITTDGAEQLVAAPDFL